MAWPSSLMVPDDGCSKPASSRISVLLPQPEGPIITVSLPRSMVKLHPRTTPFWNPAAPGLLLTASTAISPAEMTGRGVLALLIALSQTQPGRDVLAQGAQQVAGNETGNADRDHADHDLIVRAADVGVPDEETQSAAAGAADLAAAAGDHLGRYHDLPGDTHADRRPHHDGRQRAGQDDAAENVPLGRAHRLRRLKIAYVYRFRAADHIDDDGVESAQKRHERDRHLLCRPEDNRQRHPGERRNRA